MSEYNKAQWQWCAERHREGYTYKDIADFLGVSEHSVGYYVKKMLKSPKKAKLPPLESRKDEFNALISSGPPIPYRKTTPLVATAKDGSVMHFESISEAALYLGSSPGTVYNALINGYACKGWRLEEDRGKDHERA